MNSRRSRDRQEVIIVSAIWLHVWGQTLFARHGLAFGLCAAACLALAPRASAQGRLDAQYEAMLPRIPVGKDAWTIEIGDDTFSASARAARRGCEGVFRRHRLGRQPGPRRQRRAGRELLYRDHHDAKKAETIRLVLANGGVKDFSIEPAPPVDPDRIVVTDAHRKDALDPDDGLDAARARHRRSAEPGLLPHWRRHF